MFSKVEADVDEQVQEDEQDLDAVFANVDVVYDAAPFQRDADFVPLTPTRDRLRWSFCVVHVLRHVLNGMTIM